MRKDMQTLLPVDPNYDPEADEDDTPEYPTQDELLEEPSSSSSEEAREIIEFEHLYIGDIVEVYWKGEDQWFEGNITDVDAVDRQFEIFYKADSKKLWHDEKYYPVREPLQKHYTTKILNDLLHRITYSLTQQFFITPIFDFFFTENAHVIHLFFDL